MEFKKVYLVQKILYTRVPQRLHKKCLIQKIYTRISKHTLVC